MVWFLTLVLLAAPAPASPKDRLRVFVDAGHGSKGNDGNHGCFCQLEKDHTLAVAEHLAFVLSALGPFEVSLSRRGDAQPTYVERLEQADAWRADVVVSVHSDSRGEAVEWAPWGDERRCFRRDGAPGFSVLWSEEGADALVATRAKLGRVMGARLRERGLVAYDGADYGALYRQDEVEPSAWIDVRLPVRQRVFFLKASRVPTIIIETHHARDPAEVAQWAELRTVDTFAQAVAQGLLDVEGDLRFLRHVRR